MTESIDYAALPYKMVIVYRRDLQMRKGKIAAQCAHAAVYAVVSRGFFTDRGVSLRARGLTRNEDSHVTDEGELSYLMRLTPSVAAMIDGSSNKKIVLSVEGLPELEAIVQAAEERCVPCHVVNDVGQTEFRGVTTTTCLALGPYDAKLIDEITGPNGVVKTKLA